MKNIKVNRRQFLRGLGGFTLALPYLPSLLSKDALAAGVLSPGIFIQIISANSIDEKSWFPQVSSGNWTVLSDHAKRASLSNFATSGISTIFDSTYASQYKHYTFLRGLGIHGPKPGHQAGALCMGSYHGCSSARPTDWVHNATLDKVLMDSSKFTGGESLKHLSLSTAQTHGATFTSSGARSTCYTDPRALFDILFGTSTSQEPNSQVNVLNSVMSDYTRVKNDTRLSSVDRMLLEERMDMFADLQNSLNSVSECTAPLRPSSYPNMTTNSGLTNTTNHVSALMGVAIAAIKCGISRTAVWNELMPMGLQHNLHHDGSHGGDPSWTTQINYQKWIQKNIFSRFVRELDVQDGTGKTYLERAGIVHMTENGGNGIYHDLVDANIVCAGGMNGYLSPGYVFDYNHISSKTAGKYINLPINCLWNQILQSNGLTTTDYKTANQSGAGFGYSNTTWGSSYYTGMYQYSALKAGGLLPFMKRTLV